MAIARAHLVDVAVTRWYQCVLSKEPLSRLANRQDQERAPQAQAGCRPLQPGETVKPLVAARSRRVVRSDHRHRRIPLATSGGS